MRTFRLAPMSSSILIVTFVLLAIPAAFVILALLAWRPLSLPAALVIATYAWVWLRFRPTRFVVHPDAVEVVWPLKRRRLSRAGIASVRLVERRELKNAVGWAMRVGAGGLWGGFGWLWTQHRGIVQMYISRTDGFVWIDCAGDRPWLITPEHPEAFVQALAAEPRTPATRPPAGTRH